MFRIITSLFIGAVIVGEFCVLIIKVEHIRDFLFPGVMINLNDLFLHSSQLY